MVVIEDDNTIITKIQVDEGMINLTKAHLRPLECAMKTFTHAEHLLTIYTELIENARMLSHVTKKCSAIQPILKVSSIHTTARRRRSENFIWRICWQFIKWRLKFAGTKQISHDSLSSLKISSKPTLTRCKYSL